MDISGWVRENLSDSDSGPESSEFSSDDESGLFSLSDFPTTEEIMGENPVMQDREPGTGQKLNFHLSEEELKMNEHQIENAKKLYRVRA